MIIDPDIEIALNILAILTNFTILNKLTSEVTF